MDDFYSDEERKFFDELTSHYVWEFSGYSYDNTASSFWQKNLWNDPKFGSCYQIEELNRYLKASALPKVEEPVPWPELMGWTDYKKHLDKKGFLKLETKKK